MSSPAELTNTSDRQNVFSLSDRFFLRDHTLGEFVHKTWEQLNNEGKIRFIDNSIELIDIAEEDIAISVSTQLPYATSGDAIFTGDLVVLTDDLNNETHTPSLKDLYVVHFVSTCGCFGILRFIEEEQDEPKDSEILVFYRDINPDALLKVGSIYES